MSSPAKRALATAQIICKALGYARDDIVVNDMPTCAVAAFSFDCKAWSRIGKLAPVKVTLTGARQG